MVEGARLESVYTVTPYRGGWLSDSFAAGDTQNPLALAMLLTGCTASLWGGIHYLLAARSIRADLEASPSNDPIAA